MDFHKTEYAITKEDIDKLEYENKKVGVIIHIEDSEGKILLQ